MNVYRSQPQNGLLTSWFIGIGVVLSISLALVILFDHFSPTVVRRNQLTNFEMAPT